VRSKTARCRWKKRRKREGIRIEENKNKKPKKRELKKCIKFAKKERRIRKKI